MGIDYIGSNLGWCVYTKRRETICPWWAIPFAIVYSLIVYPLDCRRMHLVKKAL